MGENDIRRLLKDQGQQLTLDAETASVNRLALQDVNDYIASVTVRHMKVSMKSIYDRFQKAPYGLLRPDIQWLIAEAVQRRRHHALCEQRGRDAPHQLGR